MAATMHTDNLNRLDLFGAQHRNPDRAFQYLDFRKIVCITSADPVEDSCEQGFGLTEWILESDDEVPARLERVLTQDLLDVIDEIATQKNITIDLEKWRRNQVKVLVRHIEGKHPHDIIITPNRVFIPWPLRVSSQTQKKLKELAKAHGLAPRLLGPRELKEGQYLYYEKQWSLILNVGHQTVVNRTNENLYSYVSDTRNLLQKAVGQSFPLPAQMEFVPCGEIWDAELEYMPEVKGSKKWVMRLRGANALNPYALTIEVPPQWRVQGAQLEEVVEGLAPFLESETTRSQNGAEAALTIRIPKHLQKKGLTLHNLLGRWQKGQPLEKPSVNGGSYTDTHAATTITQATHCTAMCYDKTKSINFCNEVHAEIDEEREARNWNYREIPFEDPV